MNAQDDLFVNRPTDNTPRQPVRHWWPTIWLDEVMPPGRSSPDEYVITTEAGDLVLGYSEGADGVRGDEHKFYRIPVKVGDVVDFSYADDFPSIKITMFPDRTYEVIAGIFPDEANAFWVIGDTDTFAYSLPTFVEQWVDNDSPMEGPVTETVGVAYWSDDIKHRLVRTVEGYTFEKVVTS